MNDIFEQSTVTSVSAMLVRVVSFKGLSGSGWGVSPKNKGIVHIGICREGVAR